MDQKLVAWARAVKSSRRFVPGAGRVPVLWLFTDAVRLPDPRAAVSRLPKGLCGVVLRHDGVPGRAMLGRQLARICRARRLALVIAGDPRLAASLGAGVHLRGGRRHGLLAPRRRVLQHSALLTSSAHNLGELHRAAHAGADLAFLSPVFPTSSHPAGVVLGAAGWSRLARLARLPVAALGGIDGVSLRALPRSLYGAAGAIGGLI